MKTTCLFLLIGMLITATCADAIAQGGLGKKPKVKFTVGKDTTYVPGPFDKDGFIDYVTALNERLAKGVTPENNANVLLCQVLGPRPEGALLTAKFYKWMGTKEPPEKGDYLVSFYRYLKDELQITGGKEFEDLQDEQDMATARPWTAKQYPIVASWLKFNDKALDLAVAATKRTHYYHPLVPSENATSQLIGSLLSGVQKCRELASALPARAMLRTGEGRYDEAWQDLLATHRLGRLVGQGGTLIEGLVGIAIDHIASASDVAHLDCGKLTSKQIKDRLADLQKLPPMPSTADKVDLCERFMMLDTLMMIPRGNIKLVASLTGITLPELPKNAEKLIADVEWDPALRAVNKWCDQFAAAMRIADRTERNKQLDALEAKCQKLKLEFMDAGKFIKQLQDDKLTARDRGQMIGEAFVCLMWPTTKKLQFASDRNVQNERNLLVGFALAAYHGDHKRYPKALDELAPKYLPSVPLDLFSGKPLIYQSVEQGFRVYSVGPNGLDDQGHFYDDNPPGDDPNVRLPLPKLKKQS